METENTKRVNILLAIDDDEQSENAVDWALNHFAGPQFEFSVLHAYNYSVVLASGPPLVGVPYAYSSLYQAARESAQAQARSLLHKYSSLFKDKHRTLVECVAHKGPVKDVIISYLGMHPTNLLVVGCRGLSGLSKWLASVSYHCLYNAPCNTLVVKTCSKPPNTGPRKIVICMDGGAQSEKAFRWTRDNFLRNGDEVVLVSVQPDQGKLEEKMDAKALEYLTSFADELRTAIYNNCSCRAMVLFGKPGEVILGIVDHDTVDLLVMGSRGLGLFKRTLLGSVVDHCAAHTCVPILVVK